MDFYFFAWYFTCSLFFENRHKLMLFLVLLLILKTNFFSFYSLTILPIDEFRTTPKISSKNWVSSLKKMISRFNSKCFFFLFINWINYFLVSFVCFFHLTQHYLLKALCKASKYINQLIKFYSTMVDFFLPFVVFFAYLFFFI